MRAVARGDIYHRYFTTTIPPKYKFFVIVGETDKAFVGYFFINSNINRYVARNKYMQDMQFPVKVEDYPFLEYTSFVAGHELAYLDKQDLIDELSIGKAQFKGRMLEQDISILLGAAEQSPLFSEKEKELFK